MKTFLGAITATGTGSAFLFDTDQSTPDNLLTIGFGTAISASGLNGAGSTLYPTVNSTAGTGTYTSAIIEVDGQLMGGGGSNFYPIALASIGTGQLSVGTSVPLTNSTNGAFQGSVAGFKTIRIWASAGTIGSGIAIEGNTDYVPVSSMQGLQVNASANYTFGAGFSLDGASGANTITLQPSLVSALNVFDGTNQYLTINTSTAGVALGQNTTVAGSLIVTSAAAAAFAAGANGATNPVLQLNAATASVKSGVLITGGAAGGGVAVAAISSNATEVMTIDAKSSAAVKIGGISTGGVYLNHGTTGIGPPIVGQTLTAVTGKQSYSATDVTAANWISGLVALTGVTGAGIVTLPTGAQMSTALPPTASVTTFKSEFYCLTGQALTITGASGTTVVGTAAVPSGKNATITWLNTGSNTWNVYVTVSA